jgi:hypothetical protein
MVVYIAVNDVDPSARSPEIGHGIFSPMFDTRT